MLLREFVVGRYLSRAAHRRSVRRRPESKGAGAARRLAAERLEERCFLSAGSLDSGLRHVGLATGAAEVKEVAAIGALVGDANTVAFDFEDQTATAPPWEGQNSLTRLEMTKSGLTLTITRPGAHFEIVDNNYDPEVDDQRKPERFGARTLVPSEEVNKPFLFSFSSDVSQVSLLMGDFMAYYNGQYVGDVDALSVQAFNKEGKVLGKVTNSLPGTTSEPLENQTIYRELNVAFSGIRSLQVIGGSVQWPGSTFIDEVKVTPMPPVAPTLTKIEKIFLAYKEDSELPAYVTKSIRATAGDNRPLDHAEIRIAANYKPGEDKLSFVDPDPSDAIQGIWHGDTGALTLAGQGTAAQYTSALRSVKYENVSQNPSTDTRTVEFLVGDSLLDSSRVTRAVKVTPVNDRPVFENLETEALNYVVGQTTPVYLSGALSVKDLDSAIASVQISAPKGSKIVFSFTDTENVHGTIGTGSLILKAKDGRTATQDDFSAALRSVTVQGTKPGTYKLTITATDTVKVNKKPVTGTAARFFRATTSPSAASVALASVAHDAAFGAKERRGWYRD